MTCDRSEVVRLTGFSDQMRNSLARYYARISDTGRMEVHRIQTDLVRRSRKEKVSGKEPEFYYSQFLLALKQLHSLETGEALKHKGALSEKDAAEIARVRSSLTFESRQKPAPLKNLVDRRFYELIRAHRESGVSWRNISKYLKKYHRRNISHTHLKRCFDQISAERAAKEHSSQ